MIDTLSAFNLGSKVEILKLDDKGNTNIKGNGNNFKNYLKKEVSNTSEDKNNILNHRNEESDINTNYIEDEIIDIDLCFEISEKIEKFLDSKVYLKIFVKVRKDWRDNPLFLKEFGYKKNK